MLSSNCGGMFQLWNSPYRFPNVNDASIAGVLEVCNRFRFWIREIKRRHHDGGGQMSAARSKNLTEWVAAAERLVLNSTQESRIARIVVSLRFRFATSNMAGATLRDLSAIWSAPIAARYNAVNMRHAGAFGRARNRHADRRSNKSASARIGSACRCARMHALTRAARARVACALHRAARRSAEAHRLS